MRGNCYVGLTLIEDQLDFTTTFCFGKFTSLSRVAFYSVRARHRNCLRKYVTSMDHGAISSAEVPGYAVPLNLDPGLSFSRLRCLRNQARYLATFSASEAEISPAGDYAAAQREIDFRSAFSGLVEDVVTSLKSPGLEDVATRFKEVCEYNVPHGKLNRGSLVVDAFASFSNSPRCQTQFLDREDMVEKATILGWCVEWLQASLLVLDDVMDGSPLRRGRTSWHARSDVGIVAVNDGLFLENCVFMLLEKHFSHLPSYVPLIGLFRSILMGTIFGQSIDMTTSFSDDPLCRERLSMAFTRQRYEAICINKTALYTFVLPVLAGLRLSEISDETLEIRLSSILRKFGIWFQSQDDFLDCFGDTIVTGKTGTDIQEGKCTWLIVESLILADDSVKETLASAYGRDDSIAVAAVKDIFMQLQLPSLFLEYEGMMFQQLRDEIVNLGSFGFSTTFLLDLLKKMDKRQK